MTFCPKRWLLKEITACFKAEWDCTWIGAPHNFLGTFTLTYLLASHKLSPLPPPHIPICFYIQFEKSTLRAEVKLGEQRSSSRTPAWSAPPYLRFLLQCLYHPCLADFSKTGWASVLGTHEDLPFHHPQPHTLLLGIWMQCYCQTVEGSVQSRHSIPSLTTTYDPCRGSFSWGFLSPPKEKTGPKILPQRMKTGQVLSPLWHS